jgi:hypothetical protein
MHKYLLALVGCFAIASFAPTANAEIRLDGRLDEPEWQSAHALGELVVVDPETRAAAPQPTTVRFLATPEGLAVGIEAFGPRETRTYGRSPRDAPIMDADPIRIAVDFDGTGRAAYEFTVSLSGSVRDGVFLNQNEFSREWDGTWFHAITEDDNAWYLEVLIPWSVVPGARTQQEERTVGVWVARYLKRLGQGFAYPAVPASRASFVSEFHKIPMPRYSSGALDWFPYASITADRFVDSTRGRAGLDVLWKGDGGGQLSAALNPDFGQVEADDLVVNFSAIEVFVDEKRPFFTENQQLFDLRTTTDGRLVNTRRIGAAPDAGTAGSADILAAAKYTTTLGNTDLGAFTAIEDDNNDADGRSYFVARVRQRADHVSYGYLGTLVDRPAIDRSAQVHALDVDWFVSDGLRLRGMALGSLIDSPDARDGAGAFAILNYDRGARVSNESSITWFDKNLDINDLGFLERANMQRVRSETTWYRREFPANSSRALTQWSVELEGRRADTGAWLPGSLELSHLVRFRQPTTLEAFCGLLTPGIDDLVTRGAGLVKVPQRLECGTELTRQPHGGMRYTIGVFAFQDGVRDGFTRETYLMLRRVHTRDLSTEVSLNYWNSNDWFIWRASTQQLATFHAEFLTLQGTLNWYPGRKQEVRARLQWAGIAADQGRELVAGPHGDLALSGANVPGFRQGELGFQLRYRYELQPLSDLFVVYSRGGFLFEDSERGLGGLASRAADATTADQFLVKLRYRF